MDATPVIATLTSAQVAPIFTSITANISTMLPYGLAVMGLMIGISLIKRVVYTFL